jgi:serine/threonine protein phosphatase PrpC
MKLALTIEASAKTDIGLVRKSNQDSFGSNISLGLFVVCDGMGGAAGGEVAAQIASETFLTIARQELSEDKSSPEEGTRRALARATAAANRSVAQRAEFDARYRGMGTTLVAVRIVGSTLTAINVGDSRAYLVRAGSAMRLTIDHSYVAEQVRLGAMTEDEAESSSLQSLITRAIGAEEDVYPDLFEQPLHAGDTVLLTTDGLTRHVSDDEIAKMLAPGASRTAELACLQLIERAKERGGSDNITCVVIRLKEPE